MSETLTITLVSAEREGWRINSIADNVSDPESADYGRYLTRSELSNLVLLSDEERATIEDWLKSHGIEPIVSKETGQQLMFARGTLDQVVAAFGEDLAGRLMRDEESVSKGVRGALRIPLRLAGYIQKIGGLPGDEGQHGTQIVGIDGIDDDAEADAMAMPALKSDGDAIEPPPELQGLSPADIREIYEFPDDLDGSGETIGIMMLGGQVVHEDMQHFWRCHGIERDNVKEVYVGPRAAPHSHPLHQLELSMVVEWAGAMAPGADIVVYHIDPSKMGDPWAAFLFALTGDEANDPTIGCTSWITPERQYYSLHGHDLIAGLLNQAAALGITVISAAGDWGAFDGVPRAVKDGRKVTDAPWPHGVFMAVEERVLTIGGTMITQRHPLTEIAWSGPPPPGLQKAVHFEKLAGSGGFSEDVPIPRWQRDHLRGFYPRGAGMPAVIPYGRGFPDVGFMAAGPSVQRSEGEPMTSQGYRVFTGGQWVDFGGGTSTGSPIWGAITAIINQSRRASGKCRVGFVNPALYRMANHRPDVFRNITEGSTDVAMKAVDIHGRAVTYELGGYHAVEGWDPVSGLGVPKVATLVDAFTTDSVLPDGWGSQ